MWMMAISIIALLVIACIIQSIHSVRLKRQITYLTKLFQTAENGKDILYYCELPQLKYRYLSHAINQLGENAYIEHLQNPNKFFETVHPNDLEKARKKMAGKIDFSKPIVWRFLNDAGKYIWFEEYSMPIYQDGKLVALQGIYRNIDEKMKLMQKLKHEALHDGLTNTYNRTYFQKKMDYYQHSRNISMGVVIYDLDHLKYLNDHFGHQQGDRAIIETARLLADCINQAEAFVARIGGDEFAILLPGAEEKEVKAMGEKVEEQIKRYNQVNDMQIEVSFGYAYAQASIGNMERLYHEADQNMYLAKKAKKELARSITEIEPVS